MVIDAFHTARNPGEYFVGNRSECRGNLRNRMVVGEYDYGVAFHDDRCRMQDISTMVRSMQTFPMIGADWPLM